MLKKAMLLLVCSLLIAALPAGYAYAETESGASATEQRLEAAAEGGALAGWQCYSCGEDGERRAAPGCLSVAEGYGGGQALKISFRVATDLKKTSDEYGSQLVNMLKVMDIRRGAIAGGIISSVVPSLDYTIDKMCSPYLGISPLHT